MFSNNPSVQAWTELDSQNFLVRQRRTRIWGLAEASTGQTKERLRKSYGDAISELHSHFSFDMHQVFMQGLRTEEPRRQLEHQILQKAKDKALEKNQNIDNLFFDASTSRSRLETSVEYAVDVTTCITPTHDVYSTALQRYLLPQEFLNAQAIFRCDAAVPRAYDKMIVHLGQELAGNSFTGTVAQAVFLSSLVSCRSWTDMPPPLSEKPADSGTPELHPQALPSEPSIQLDISDFAASRVQSNIVLKSQIAFFQSIPHCHWNSTLRT